MKKLFTILAAAVVVSLAACNGSGSTEGTDSTSVGKDTTAKDEVTAPAPADSSSANADTTHKM